MPAKAPITVLRWRGVACKRGCVGGEERRLVGRETKQGRCAKRGNTVGCNGQTKDRALEMEATERAATQRMRGPLREGERERWRAVTGKQASARGRTGELVQRLDEDEEVPGAGGRAPRRESK